MKTLLTFLLFTVGCDAVGIEILPNAKPAACTTGIVCETPPENGQCPAGCPSPAGECWCERLDDNRDCERCW